MKFDFKQLDPRRLDLKKIDLKSVDRKWWIGGGAIVLILIAIVFFGRRSRAAEGTTAYQTVTVERGTLTSTVASTGSVRADQSTTLMWQTSGRVESVTVQIGDKVKADEVLANLLQSSLPQTVILAQGDLVDAQQALESLVKSNTARAQAEQAVADAQQTLSDAQKKLASLSYPRASDALIRNTKDQLVIANRNLGNATKRYHQFSHLGENSLQRAQAEEAMTSAMMQITKLQGNYNYYTGKPSDLDFSAAKAAVAVAEAQLEDAQRELERVKDGPTADDLAVAQAKVAAAQATLNEAKIIAPFDGVVTQADSRPGDLVAEGKTAFRLDDTTHLLVDLEVTEVDINNIAAGQPVTVTFDAIPNQSYQGKVVKVNQSGDVSNNAVSFTVTVEVADPDKLVKPGMTASVTITTHEVADALLVPNRALKTVDGKRVVYKLQNGQLIPVQVQVGAVSDTSSEIIGGNLQAGDEIVTNPTGATANSTTRTGLGGGGGGTVRFP